MWQSLQILNHHWHITFNMHNNSLKWSQWSTVQTQTILIGTSLAYLYILVMIFACTEPILYTELFYSLQHKQSTYMTYYVTRWQVWKFSQYLLLPSMHILSRLKSASFVAILFPISIIKTKTFWCLNWPGNFQKPSKFLWFASKCAAYIHHSLGDTV